MPVVIQQIVGQFELIEGNDLLHPLRPFGRGVRVVMHPPGGGGVGFAGHQPGGAVKGVPAGGEGTLSRGPGGSRHRPPGLAGSGPGRSPRPSEDKAPPPPSFQLPTVTRGTSSALQPESSREENNILSGHRWNWWERNLQDGRNL